ncbi:metal-dependent hydrolase [Qipengyuania qiaonensis]|uniref:Metal-dependent hydrolase n=1 Tax=Qipengyuania qiaonensis TaxID=2867240 RepID=A0ABS7JAT8_9SPHN|nr:metal-dependent hydrolase [Qipengyuania qiaonensis]MBX7483060.1 metal-dependent hydrolase [Qipengyuania qiaonensis]
MNAPVSIDTDTRKFAPTPEDLTITVRDERFNRGTTPRRWWAGEPFGTAWHNALSATFPRGEAFFIESVKAFREGADPKLESEIRAFVKQEINHTREHIAFNRLAEDHGYDIKAIDQRVAEMLQLLKGRPEILNLAATMALEHYTAMMAAEFLANEAHFADADAEVRDMWRWHAAEEIEHKGVAFDTWNHATRDWSAWKRWKVRSLMMLLVTGRFFRNRWQDSMNLLAQDGIVGWKARWGLFRYLTVSPGVVRRILPEWLAYFKPGFHPWDHDDRKLIEVYEGDFPDALMPAE